MTPEEFHTELGQIVAARAAASSDFTESALAEIVAESLAESGAIQEFVPCPFRMRAARIDGYGYNDEESTLDLFVVEYFGKETAQSLTKTVMDQCFRRAEVFFERACRPGFSEDVEVTHPVWGLARQLNEQAATIVRVRVNLISDGILSAAVKEIPSSIESGREWVFRVWDLRSIERLMNTGEPEEIVIDFPEMFGASLPCLPAHSSDTDISCYLAVVPGSWLASIYDRYGGRLLEQNVRTFLQVKGKVNKGIRKTILEEPEMFFSYNNGISATAAYAEFDDGGGIPCLTKVRNLQIVNGGQTTASIFNVLKKEKGKNLDLIRVQMKLSVVKPELVDQTVPKISEYANSQNKVSAADFFSNHPFHVRIEGMSRRIWAPAADGIQIQTHWFYERARGQYANAQAYLTPARKREFELHHPRNHLIAKTDLAKTVMTFRGAPHVVSTGAQKNFAKFAEYVGDAWKEEGADFGDEWFKQMVAQTICFRTLERLVQEAEWYAQGYRANIVTYSIALMQHSLTKSQQRIDFEKIWAKQNISEMMGQVLISIGHQVQTRIIEAAASYGVSNVTEWCKREKCWDDLKAHLNLADVGKLEDELISSEQDGANKRDGRRNQRMTNDVEAQRVVVERGGGYWQALLRWAEKGTSMTPSELDVLKIAATIPRRIPTGLQSLKILGVEAKALDEGYKLPSA